MPMRGRYCHLDYDMHVRIRANVSIWQIQTYGEGMMIKIYASREVGCPNPICQVSKMYIEVDDTKVDDTKGDATRKNL